MLCSIFYVKPIRKSTDSYMNILFILYQTLGKLLESLMMAREAGHIPGIIGRLGDLGKKQLNIQLLLTLILR